MIALQLINITRPGRPPPTTFPPLITVATIPDYIVIRCQWCRRQRNQILYSSQSCSLAVRVVLFVICLVENSIAIFILYKNIRKGRKTFARYTLISVACTDILNALLYYLAEFVRFKHGELVWLVQGQAGDFLCKIYVF